MKLANILKEVLSEIGDLSKVQALPFDTSSPLDYYFHLEDGTLVKLNFAPISSVSRYGTFTTDSEAYDKDNRDLSKEFNTSFVVGGSQHQYTKSDLRSFNRLLKTIVVCVKDFVEKNDVDALWIFGVDKSGRLAGDRQKNILYKALTQNNLPPDYQMAPATLDARRVGYDSVVQGWVAFK